MSLQPPLNVVVYTKKHLGERHLMIKRSFLGILLLTILAPVALFFLAFPTVMSLLMFTTAITAFDKACSIVVLVLYFDHWYRRIILIVLNNILDVIRSWVK